MFLCAKLQLFACTPEQEEVEEIWLISQKSSVPAQMLV